MPNIYDLTTIVIEFGKLRYNRVPIGICAYGDIFQAKVEELLGDIEVFKPYIENILVLDKGRFYQHIDQVIVIFSNMCVTELKVNYPKCSFGLKDITYLGYIIIWEGIKPDPKKKHVKVDVGRHNTTTEVQALIRMVQYYRYIWPRWSQVISPMLEAAIRPKGREIIWNNDMELTFCNLKHMISTETLLNYTDWTIPFTVHTDASDQQLGAVISQNNKHISFFSRKLSKPQRNYTTPEKELILIVECLK